MIRLIETAESSRPQFRKTKEVFAIRRFLKQLPAAASLIFNDNFKSLVHEAAGPKHFVIKSIYFDKPEGSNWFVAWHQDLTIAVDKKTAHPGYSSWTVKQGAYAVQPPIDILENSFTFRIHLDDTDEHNGALKVIPYSHNRGIVRPESSAIEQGEFCTVHAGGVMVMRPLLLHASGRVQNNRRRRVIHIEFCDRELPGGLGWAEA